MIELLDIVDWSFDAGALLLAIFIAHWAHNRDTPKVETLKESATYMLIILLIYGSHEVWERFFDSHEAVEQTIVDIIITLV